MFGVFFVVGVAAFFGTALTWWSRYERGRRAGFLSVFADDARFTAAGAGVLEQLRVATNPPLSGGIMVAASGDKNMPSRWEIVTSLPALAARTTLLLTEEGFVGMVREKLGQHDIHVGDPEFDDTVCLRGSNADVVRAVFSDDDVKRTAIALFACAVWQVRLDATGALTIRLLRTNTELAAARARDPQAPAGVAEGRDARDKFLCALAFIDALERASARPALAASSEALHAAVSAGGSPVGVPS